MVNCRDLRLFCHGSYPDILVYNPFTLEVIFTLNSRMQPDWISAMCLLRPAKREGKDVMI